MLKNKGEKKDVLFILWFLYFKFCLFYFYIGKGGKNWWRGKNENELEKCEFVFKEDG